MRVTSPKSQETEAASVRDAMARAEESRRAKQYKEGISVLVEALHYGIDRTTIYYRLGNIYIDAGDLTRAEYVYKRALDLDPRHINAMHNLAIVYKRQRKIGLYVKTLKKSQRLALRHPRNYNLDPEAKGRVRALSGKVLFWTVGGFGVAVLLFWALSR